MVQSHAPPNGCAVSERKNWAIGAVVAQQRRHVASGSEHQDWYTQSVGHGGGVVCKRLVHTLAWVTGDPANWEGMLSPESPLSLVLCHAAQT